MKLLLDQNLSPRLIERLSHVFPESGHVSLLRLDRASDSEIWQYAKNNNYIIVSKDADFSELSALEGIPPKVIWIRRRNCTTLEIENILSTRRKIIEMFGQNEQLGILMLS